MADPAEGCLARGRGAFEARWSGFVLLALRPKAAPRRELLEEARASALGRMSLPERGAYEWCRARSQALP